MTEIYQVKKNLLLAEKDEFLYVLDVELGRVHSFNITGKIIFQLCMEPRTIREIVREYLNYFDVSEAVGLRDVKTVLNKFSQYELLQPGTTND